MRVYAVTDDWTIRTVAADNPETAADRSGLAGAFPAALDLGLLEEWPVGIQLDVLPDDTEV